jgi:glycosyltransferase involved in cell wall biosynthesis
MTLPRVAVICDFLEEKWPSMDLVGEMLFTHLQADHSEFIAATRICPSMRRRLTLIGNGAGSLFNADRFLNRFWDYPQWLRRRKAEFDLFHIVDHSYGQLVHRLPASRTVVTCHDLDAFRCIVDSRHNSRSRLFKAMTRHVLSGFCKAARVTCDSDATRDELLAHGLFPPGRMVVIPNGVHPDFGPDPDPLADAEAAPLLGPASTNAIDILHVGSTIPRKRIDVLLRIVAEVRKEFKEARLIRVGGDFTAAQQGLIRRLELAESVIVLPFLQRSVLAAIYRRAALLLLPSESEGFGLPVVEAMACGTPVVASDLPVLREVGGKAAAYCPVADVPSWSASCVELLYEKHEQPDRWSVRRTAGIAQAAKYSWAEYTKRMVALYQEVLES